jgi:hypothetical protein
VQVATAAAIAAGVLAASGCGGPGDGAGGLYSSAATKSCLQGKGIDVDTTGKKWATPISAAAVAQFGVLEFALATRHNGRTDKAAVLFLPTVPQAKATLNRFQHAWAKLIADLQPTADQATFGRLARSAQEQHRNVVIMWANFGGSPAGRRLAVGCLR